MEGADPAALEAAREAAARYAWADALDLFTEADAAGSLGPDDLDLEAQAAWWSGKMRASIAARERAHAAYLQAGNARRAAFEATQLADHHADLGEMSVASAWLNRARKLLAEEPECAEHAWLKMAQAFAARGAGDLERALTLSVEAADVAARQGDKDVFALALGAQGTTLVTAGEVERGIALVEEATVAAVSGELGPYATGWIYCMMISITSAVADWQRAGQWTEAAKRWCEKQTISGFPGVCRVHRAEIMRLRGSFSEAEQEARAATSELGSFNLHFSALAFKELGEVRLRMGDLDAAEDAFRQANEMGVVPQPGLALAQLHRGKPEAAASSLKRALSEELPPIERAKMLPAQQEIALATGDLETARAAASELAGIAGSYTSPALQAMAAASAAALCLAEGDPASAEGPAKRARRLYKDTDMIYEAARVSLLLGEICHAAGDIEGARFEIESALATFEKIGAVPDADRARALLGSLAGHAAGAGTRIARTFVFSDIVRSTNLLEAIGDEAWGDLLKWHDATLRRLFRSHDGEEVVHTGDGFFVAFASADAAIACATAIQRSLADHRREHGFAPQVRIGVHATEASQARGNYLGRGVHEAARIGALAEGGEILVSASTLACLSAPAAAGEERTVRLKGMATPMQVVPIDWRGPQV